MKKSFCNGIFVLQKVKEAILDQMVAEGKKEQLKSFEQVRVNVYSPIGRVTERYRDEYVFHSDAIKAVYFDVWYLLNFFLIPIHKLGWF